MGKTQAKNIIMLLIIADLLSCRQPYFPPIAKSNLGYLVVDGIIINGQDSTIINLSRTDNLTDSNYAIRFESSAIVNIVGPNFEVHALKEQGNGRYVTDHLDLNINEAYQLSIITSNGDQYLSDAVSILQTPPIDSVSWTLDNKGVNIFLTTHDPQNNTRYYRWDYTETWEYNTDVDSYFDWINNQIVLRDSNDQIYNCWSSDNSTELLIGNSAKISQGIIYQMPIASVPAGSEKINKEYSIIVRQYAITEAEYDFLQNVKNNSEQLGGLFDPQPTEISANIHCTNNPNQKAVGFIGASTLSSQRIFINRQQLAAWKYIPYYQDYRCDYNAFIVPADSMNYYFPQGNISSYVLLGQLTVGDSYTVIGADCADCRAHGGTNIKPSFWPN